MSIKFAFLKSAVFVSCSVIASGALAESVGGEADKRDVITVVGTKFNTPLDQVGRSVSVVTSDMIDLRQQRFVYDALNAVPGVQVIGSGSFGALSTVSIRGLPSAQTLVVQDGVVLNDPSSFSNGFNFANFNAIDVKQIEVLRGAQSTLYGSDAIGGVINIITEDGREGFGGEAFVEGGSFDTLRGAASLFGGNETASGRISFSGVTTNGFSTADEANGNVEDDSYDNITLSGKGRFAPLETLVFEGVVRYQESESEFDAFTTLPVDGDEIALTDELSLAGSATHALLDGALENKASLSYLRIESLNLSSGVASYDALGTRVSYEYQGKVSPVSWAAIVAGAEYDIQESEVTVGFGGNQKIKTASGYGLLQLNPNDYISLNGGVRYDTSKDFGSETTFNVSAALTVPQTNTLLRGSYSEGFRAPSAGELGFNPDLFAEFSEGWDIGVEQPIFEGRARVSAAYFDQKIDDLIAFDLGTFTFVNIQNYSSKGVEVALDADISEGLSFHGAYTYVDAVNLSTTIAAGNQPKHHVNIELAARPIDRLTLSLGVNYNGQERAGVTMLDAFTLVNIRSAYEVTDNLELFARLENATDADYQDQFGYGTAPLSAYGGVRARF